MLHELSETADVMKWYRELIKLGQKLMAPNDRFQTRGGFRALTI